MSAAAAPVSGTGSRVVAPRFLLVSGVPQGERLAGPDDALELVPAAVVEHEPGPVDEVARRRRGEDLAGPGDREQARCEMDGQPADVVADDFDLAGMDRGPDLEVERRADRAHLTSAGESPRGRVEPDEESVPGRLD